jgi:hypothetical protein
MKLTPSLLIKAVKKNNTQSDKNSSIASFATEIQNSNHLTDLYHKCEYEPDFDCEFLHAGHDRRENESIIDSESEDELLDEFNDNMWDVDIYDPYLESTYY